MTQLGPGYPLRIHSPGLLARTRRHRQLESEGVGTSAETIRIADRVGLCARCQHGRVIRSDRGATFFLCRVADIDPRFPKYPRLPVSACDRFEERSPDKGN